MGPPLRFRPVIVRRFFDPKLAQTSYLLACGRAGVGVVVDPNRDLDQYVQAAESEGVRISHVTETHIHADFVSGSRALAQLTGATLLLSDEGDANWKYPFAREAGATLLTDGDQFMVGNVRLEVMHTPGHTPEHLSFLVTDTAAADEPIGIVTGDFVFVGDVGRPDLLERAARMAGTMEGAARALFRSLQRFKQFPDWLQIWPGHGAGSACGKGLSAVPHSTVGYEKRFNWAFAIDDEATFARTVLEGQPEPPRYFAEMKRVNKEGAPAFDFGRRPPVVGVGVGVGVEALKRALADGTPVVDTREAAAFAAQHVTGTINIPLNKSFNTWAGWLVPYDRNLLLLVAGADGATIDEAVRDLAMIGLDRVTGVLGDDVISAWAKAGGATGTVRQLSAAQVAAGVATGEFAVVDVRGASEWDEAHIAGAPNIPVGLLGDRIADLPRAKTLVVQCQRGGRSSIAASVLLAHGISNVANLTGGITAWTAAGLPVERS